MGDPLIWLDGPLGLVLIAVLVLLAIGWYLSYLAARLDRLHHRVESALAALEARLARRAAAALELARLLPAPAAAPLSLAAGRALNEPPVHELAENELTRALHRTFEPAAPDGALLLADPRAAVQLGDLRAAAERAQLARRFHNDAVAHAQRMRRKRVVRWARLAGRARMPQMVEIDDSVPAGLAELPVRPWPDGGSPMARR